jgi:hypothetical protein
MVLVVAVGWKFDALFGLTQQPTQRILPVTQIEFAMVAGQIHHLAEFLEREVRSDAGP